MSLKDDDSATMKFLNAVNNGLMLQHVHEPTRLRLNEKENILDLAFTNKPGILSDIKILPGIGKSDHNVITFTLHCSYQQESKPKIKLMYNKCHDTHSTIFLSRNFFALDPFLLRDFLRRKNALCVHGTIEIALERIQRDIAANSRCQKRREFALCVS